jgi:hypothetical protein
MPRLRPPNPCRPSRCGPTRWPSHARHPDPCTTHLTLRALRATSCRNSGPLVRTKCAPLTPGRIHRLFTAPIYHGPRALMSAACRRTKCLPSLVSLLHWARTARWFSPLPRAVFAHSARVRRTSLVLPVQSYPPWGRILGGHVGINQGLSISVFPSVKRCLLTARWFPPLPRAHPASKQASCRGISNTRTTSSRSSFYRVLARIRGRFLYVIYSYDPYGRRP